MCWCGAFVEPNFRKSCHTEAAQVPMFQSTILPLNITWWLLHEPASGASVHVEDVVVTQSVLGGSTVTGCSASTVSYHCRACACPEMVYPRSCLKTREPEIDDLQIRCDRVH